MTKQNNDIEPPQPGRPLSERPYAITFTKPSRTKQAFTEASNINNIMLRYQKTGIIDHVNKHQGQYADLDGAEYTDYMNKIASAQSMFEELPSKARKAFDHDPAKFLEYVNNLNENDNAEKELIEMGLMQHRVPLKEMEPTPTPPPENQDANEA